jgi:lipoate synthase
VLDPQPPEELLRNHHRSSTQLAEVFSTWSEVLAHNVDTVPWVFMRIRPTFTCERSLHVISEPHAVRLVTKSNTGVMSGPLIRSSYRAGRLYQQASDARTITVTSEAGTAQPPDVFRRGGLLSA